MPTHDLKTVQINPEELTLHPENPNHGDVEAIANSIQVNGFYEPVIVQASTGYVISGNHRVKAARALNLETIPAVRLDVDDTAARRILLASNATAQKAVLNDLGVARVLQLIQQEDEDVMGTGYDDDEVSDYLVMLEHDERETARFAEHAATPDQPQAAQDSSAPPAATPGAPVPGGATDTDAPPAADFGNQGTNTKPKFTPDAQRINAARRLMVLDLPIEVFAWLAARLEEVGDEHGLSTNAEIILHLAADATGTDAPRLTGPEYSDPDSDGVPDHE